MPSHGGLVLRRARVVTPHVVIPRGYVAIDSGRIVDVGEEPYGGGGGFDELHLDGMVVGPGFIDTHIHGGFGIDLSTATVGEIVKLSELLPRFGVTSFVPTSVTLPRDDLAKFCRNVLAASKMRGGARVLGVHLEGPFLNPRRAGAQNPEHMRPADVSEFDELAEASGGLLRSITVAPEVEGALHLVRHAVMEGVVVQIGHTDATYHRTREALAIGASKATHLYNAMSGMHHRSPGAALALLRADNTYLELIVDFVHVAPEVVSFTLEYAKHRRIVLVSDSTAAAGLPDGTYRLGGLDVEVRNGVARLAGRDVLAGSTLTMWHAFRNALSLGTGLGEAFHMASTAPAESIGAAPELGAIVPGRRADITVLRDDFSVAATFVDGELVYAGKDFEDVVGK